MAEGLVEQKIAVMWSVGKIVDGHYTPRPRSACPLKSFVAPIMINHEKIASVGPAIGKNIRLAFRGANEF